MTEPTDALLPCPFCGAAPESSSCYFAFECETCGAHGPTADSAGDEAIALWNRRTPAPVGVEPIGVVGYTVHGTQYVNWLSNKAPAHGTPIYTSPQPTKAQAVAMPLTDREIELIDGMIQVQLDHASRCDAIANRSMADKQKGWDMERVALLQKFKAQGIKGGQHGTE